MKSYKKIPDSGNTITDLFISWYNLKLMRGLVVRIAWNEHQKTGREVHIAEMFGSFIIFDSRERQDLNNSGKINRLNIYEALRASIWNSTAEETRRKKIISKSQKL